MKNVNNALKSAQTKTNLTNMTNSRRANLRIVDQHWQKKDHVPGLEILPIGQAWQKLSWIRAYFEKEPQQGYFIWVKEQPSCSLISCVNISQAEFIQDLQNLVVVEPGLKVDLTGECSALSPKLQAKHQAQGKMILKPGAQVKYQHFHTWGKLDFVSPDYQFILQKGSQLNYTFKTLKTAAQVKLNNHFELAKQANLNLTILADCAQTEFSSLDQVVLKGAGASAISKLKFVTRSKTKISAHSKMTALAPAKGHLDCQSLNLNKDNQVSLIPEIKTQHKKAQLTHEASIGTIAPEQLHYLQLRGLTQKEAIELIINGFMQK